MEFKGTKGDWRITEYWTDTQIELGTDEQPCIAIFEKDWFSNEEEFKTNITLIKHSKEMFEALNIILQELRDINVLENQANYIEQLINKVTTI